MRHSIWLVVSAFGLLGAAPASADASLNLVSSGQIRFLTNPIYPPMEFVDPKTGALSGFDIDLGKAIAAGRAIRRHGHRERTGIGQQAIGLPSPVAREDILHPIIANEVERRLDMRTIAEPRAGQDADPIFAIIVLLRGAILRFGLDALEILLEDEVHHARDGIRAPLRGCAAGHHLGALDHGLCHRREQQDMEVVECGMDGSRRSLTGRASRSRFAL